MSVNIVRHLLITSNQVRLLIIRYLAISTLFVSIANGQISYYTLELRHEISVLSADLSKTH